MITKNVTVILQTNNLFKQVDFNSTGEVTGMKTRVADNKSGASVQIEELGIDASFTVEIWSKKRLITTITGIVGQLQPGG